ncbi:MAG TPA: hypothetical protein VFS20_32105 [Longimicrobium sp.]|nr:hypothetical protein [Longimicrobium sp.]
MIPPVLAACAALVLRASAPEAGMCSCAGPLTDAEALQRNPVVFEGRPIRSRRERRGDGGFRRMVRVYTFQVTRWRKGTPRRVVEVQTGMGGGDCGIVFQRGRTYTVYAGPDDRGRLGTGICSGPYLPLPDPPPDTPGSGR